MKRSTPRIIKTVRSSNRTPVRLSKNSNTEVIEKKTVNVTHTVSSTTVPLQSKPLQRGTRRSNRQIMVNRKVEGSRGYTPIKRTIIKKDQMSTTPGNSGVKMAQNMTGSVLKETVTSQVNRGLRDPMRYSNKNKTSTQNGNVF